MDYDSPFRIGHDSEPPGVADSSNTPTSSSGTPTPETFTPGATPSISIGAVNSPTTPRSNDIFEPESGESHALLVNHRVAYSQRRQLTSNGMLFSQDMSSVEEWMLPLASAYLLQVPVKTSAPSREQLSLETQAVEVSNGFPLEVINSTSGFFLYSHFSIFSGSFDTFAILTDGVKCASRGRQTVSLLILP